MDSNEYNIDDILSEVKKRKEGNQNAEKTVSGENKTESEENTAPAPRVEKTEEKSINPPAPPEKETEVSQSDEAPESVTTPENTADKDGNGMINLMDFAETGEEPQGAPEGDESPAAQSPTKEKNAPDDKILPDDETDGGDSKKGKKDKKKKPKSKAKKILTSVIIILLVLILAAGGVFAFTANDWINDIIKNSKDTNSGQTASTEEWKGMDKLVENFDPIQETEATELASLEDMVQSWYYNGAPCSSTHVLNVLLIGEDTRGDEILDEGTRADSAIIVSVNIYTKKITMTSILRDSWGYWEKHSGKKDSGKFGKINGAMSDGDINCYKRTIEQLYKVKLDGYAIVNFDSFEKIVDALGGVTLELTDAEIKEINRHPKRYGHVEIKKEFSGTKGKQKLNGKQALAYCRIRHIDSDGARADRQKTCLYEIFEETKDASMTKLIKVIQSLIPYVKTSFGKNEIVKIATYAISKGWLDYDTVMANVPEMNVKGGTFKPDFGGQWVWKADFPADAYIVQKRIYGKSNITLAHERVDVKTVRQSGIYADGARATDAVYTNNNYGEESTVPTTAKAKESTSTSN